MLSPELWGEDEISGRQMRIGQAVRLELEKLPDSEREFVELYWFQGRSTSEIARLLNCKPYNLVNLNRRIMRKLKNSLADFVEEEFRLRADHQGKCRICCHPDVEKINLKLKSKKPHETYRGLIRLLKTDYGIDIKTPQAIIGHLKYHLREEL